MTSKGGVEQPKIVGRPRPHLLSSSIGTTINLALKSDLLLPRTGEEWWGEVIKKRKNVTDFDV